MKRNLASLILILLTTFTAHNAIAEITVSHPSGNYNVDSLYFEVTAPGMTLEIAWNSEDYFPFPGGQWLYPRTDPNTWENEQFSRGPFEWWHSNIDTLQDRGILKKAHVLHIRATNQDTTLLKTVIIHMNENLSVPIVDLDFSLENMIGPRGFYGPGLGVTLGFPFNQHYWNYQIEPELIKFFTNPVSQFGFDPDLVMEKPALVSILDTTGQQMLEQPCGIRITGNSSVNLMCKAVTTIAKPRYGGPNRFFSSLFGGYTSDKEYRYRMAGGSQMYGGWGRNEIVARSLSGLGIHEVNTRLIRLYFRGSLWTMAYAQPKWDEYGFSKYTGIDHDDVSIAKLTSISYIGDNLATMQIPPGLDTASFIEFKKGNNRYMSVAPVEGSPEVFDEIMQAIFDSIVDSIEVVHIVAGQQHRFVPKPNSYKAMGRYVEMDRWLYYITAVNFWQLTDAVGNNIAFASVPGRKLWPMAKDFDNAMEYHLNYSQWQHLASFDTTQSFGLPRLINRIIFSTTEGRERLVLAYQDVLNTAFKTERIVDIAYTTMNEVMQNYEETHIALGGWPNGGVPPAQMAISAQQNVTFCQTRNNPAMQSLIDFFLPNSGFTPASQNNVKLDMRLVSGTGAKVRFNTLTLQEDYEGLYLPEPALQLSMEVPDGYEGGWLEYPDSAATMQVSVTSPITLTPTLKKIVTSIEEVETFQFNVMPNPSSGIVLIQAPAGTQISDLTGRVVFTTTQANQSLTLTNGIYIAHYKNAAKKFVILK